MTSSVDILRLLAHVTFIDGSVIEVSLESDTYYEVVDTPSTSVFPRAPFITFRLSSEAPWRNASLFGELFSHSGRQRRCSQPPSESVEEPAIHIYANSIGYKW
jgi:hypothetical protein